MRKRNRMIKKLVSLVCAFTAAIAISPIGTIEANAEETATEKRYQLEAELCSQDDANELSIGDSVYASGQVKDMVEGRYLSSDEWGFYSDENMKDFLDENGLPLRCYSELSNKENALEDAVAFDKQIPEEAFGKYVYYFLGAYGAENDLLDLNLFRSKYPVTAWDNKGNYTVSLNDDNKSVTVFAIWKGKSVSIPSTIKVNGKSYKINAVGDYAIEEVERKSLTSVSLDSGITKIGKEAFKGAGKLKAITIKGNVTSIGKNAFAGINKNAVIKIKASKKNYDKIVKKIKAAGAPKTVKFKRVA